MTAPLIRVSALVALAFGLVACSSAPPVPDWQLNARDATQRGTQAYLEGRSRVSEAEFARARREAARSARADAVGRIELARCAAQVASLSPTDCPAVLPLAADMSPPLQAYWRYLRGQPASADVPVLPPAQQAAAARLLPPLTGTAPLSVLPEGDALSRLLAAAVLVQAGQGNPAVVAVAVQTASDQGWTRPLLAWLGWQLRQAKAAGDAELARLAQRRMDLLLASQKID